MFIPKKIFEIEQVSNDFKINTIRSITQTRHNDICDDLLISWSITFYSSISYLF